MRARHGAGRACKLGAPAGPRLVRPRPKRQLSIIPPSLSSLSLSTFPAEPAAALRDYATAVRAEPTNLAAALGVATALEALDKTQEAIVAFSAVLRADPAHVRALFARGSLYNRVGDFERANCDLERALELDGQKQQHREKSVDGGKAGAAAGGGLSLAARAGGPPPATTSSPPAARQPPLRLRSVSPVVIAKASFSVAEVVRVPAVSAVAEEAAAAAPAAATTTLRPPSAAAAAAAERHRAAGYKARKAGDLDVALARYTRALAIHPALFSARFDRAFLYHQMGQLDASVDDYTAALAASPDPPAAAATLFNRGISLDCKGDEASTRAAIDDFTASLAADRGGAHAADALHNRGYARRRLGEHGGALADYTAALACDPAHIRALLNRAALLARSGTPASLEDAVADYRAALALEGTNVGAHHLLGGLLERLGREEEAVAAYRASIDAASSGGRASSRGSSPPPAAAAPSYHARGLLRERSGVDPDAALADLRAAAAADPAGLAYHTSLAAALRSRGRHTDAAAGLATALDSCAPEDAPPLLAARGAALRRAGMYGNAVASYLRAIAACAPAPAPPRYHICAGFCLAKCGQFSAAVEQYDAILQDASSADKAPGGCGDHHARLNRGACLQRLGQVDEALADFQKVIASGPPPATLAAALMNKGACLDATGDPARREEAVQCYQLALSADAEAAAVAAGGEEEG